MSQAADVVAENVSAFLGVDMGSSRYATAVQNPANAGIIALLTNAEARNGIPAGLLVRQAWQESRFNPSAVNAVSGAKGLMQFMDATANEWGVDVFDPASSAEGAARYMAWLYKKLGSWSLALAAYNWGIGNVMRKGMALAPKETRDYVAQIGADSGLV
jgi:soluble lytic murein transglycosylase-like protein